MNSYKINPLISIIIPAYNRDKIIQRTLSNILRQSYRPLEIIIIDDGSQDSTIQKVNNFKKRYSNQDFNIIIFKNKINKGACFSRNVGITNSKGDFIQFLDSDDYLDNEKIATQIKYLQKSNSKLAISDYRYIKNKKVTKICKNDGNLFKKVSLGWSIHTSSPLVKSTLIKKKIIWNEKISLLQDKDFLFKVLMISGEYVYTPNVFANYNQHEFSQISDNYNLRPPQFIIMIISRLNFLFSNLLKLKIIHSSYTILGVLEILYRFIIYYKKKIFIKIFGYNSFKKLKIFFKR